MKQRAARVQRKVQRAMRALDKVTSQRPRGPGWEADFATAQRRLDRANSAMRRLSRALSRLSALPTSSDHVDSRSTSPPRTAPRATPPPALPVVPRASQPRQDTPTPAPASPSPTPLSQRPDPARSPHSPSASHTALGDHPLVLTGSSAALYEWLMEPTLSRMFQKARLQRFINGEEPVSDMWQVRGADNRLCSTGRKAKLAKARSYLVYFLFSRFRCFSLSPRLRHAHGRPEAEHRHAAVA